MAESVFPESSNPDLNDIMETSNSDNDNIDNPLQLLNIESKYYDIENIKDSIPTDIKFKYKTIHINIKSLPDKHDKLKLFLHRLKDADVTIDFILLCETFLTSRNADLYEIPGYKFIHKSRSILNCGGVGMYKREGIHFKIRNDLSLFYEGEFESIFIETSCDRPSIIGEIYRIPSSNELASLSRFETITEMLKNINRDIIIGTDQNFDYLKIHTHKNTTELLNQFFSCGLVPCITKPTRITHSTATLIDNLYVKAQREHKLHSGIILFEFADHLPVFLFSGKATKQKCKDPLTFKYRQLNHPALCKIQSSLVDIDWDELYHMNVDDAYNSFSDQLQQTIDKFAPEKSACIPYKCIIRDPWVTKGILRSSKTADKLFKAKLKHPSTHPTHIKYVCYRNMFNKIK